LEKTEAQIKKEIEEMKKKEKLIKLENFLKI